MYRGLRTVALLDHLFLKSGQAAHPVAVADAIVLLTLGVLAVTSFCFGGIKAGCVLSTLLRQRRTVCRVLAAETRADVTTGCL